MLLLVGEGAGRAGHQAAFPLWAAETRAGPPAGRLCWLMNEFGGGRSDTRGAGVSCEIRQTAPLVAERARL